MIELSYEQINQILKVLGEIPAKLSFDVIAMINSEAVKQNKKNDGDN